MYFNNNLYSTDVDEQQYCSSSKKIHTRIFTLVKSIKKNHCESQFQLKLKMLGKLLAKIIQLKKVFQVKSTLVLVKRPMLFEL